MGIRIRVPVRAPEGRVNCDRKLAGGTRFLHPLHGKIHHHVLPNFPGLESNSCSRWNFPPRCQMGLHPSSPKDCPIRGSKKVEKGLIDWEAREDYQKQQIKQGLVR